MTSIILIFTSIFRYMLKKVSNIVQCRTHHLMQFLVLSLIIFLSPHYVLAENVEVSVQPEIHTFGPGVHYLNRIILESPHALIEGKGIGVTILKIKEGIWATAPEPIIRNLTIIGEGKGVGIKLSNTWSAKIENVEIEKFKVGMKLELNKDGRELVEGGTMNHWPGAMTKGKHWGSRISLSSIRNIEIVGPGDGIVFENTLKHSTKQNYWKSTDDKRRGEFMNATTLWGGHIAVKGRAVVIGDGVASTKMFGTYIDISPAGGIIMEYGARGLTLVGVALDLNSAARKEGAARILVPKRAKKSVQMIGMQPVHIDINYYQSKK